MCISHSVWQIERKKKTKQNKLLIGIIRLKFPFLCLNSYETTFFTHRVYWFSHQVRAPRFISLRPILHAISIRCSANNIRHRERDRMSQRTGTRSVYIGGWAFVCYYYYYWIQNLFLLRLRILVSIRNFVVVFIVQFLRVCVLAC